MCVSYTSAKACRSLSVTRLQGKILVTAAHIASVPFCSETASDTAQQHPLFGSMDRQRRPSTVALEAFVEDSFNRRKRKSTPPQQPTTASGASAETIYEHYKFDEQESSIHLEWRAQRGQAQLRMMRIVTEVFVYSLGLGLGLLVGSMTIASRVRPAPSLPLPCPRTPQPLLYPHLPSPTLASGIAQCGHVRHGPGTVPRRHRGVG